MHGRTKGRTDSPKTECFRPLMAGEDIKMLTFFVIVTPIMTLVVARGTVCGDSVTGENAGMPYV